MPGLTPKWVTSGIFSDQFQNILAYMEQIWDFLKLVFCSSYFGESK